MYLSPTQYRPPVRSLAALAFLLVLALGAAGCGGNGSTTTSTRSKAVTTTTTTVDEDATPDPQAADRLKREHDQLMRAYEPASQYLNYFTSAFELYETGLGPARDAVAVARQYRRILQRADSEVARVRVEGTSGALRRELLVALRSRIQAMSAVQTYLAAPNGTAGASARATFEDAYDVSIGSARVATNLVQADREELGLEPAREDALR